MYVNDVCVSIAYKAIEKPVAGLNYLILTLTNAVLSQAGSVSV